MIPTKRIRPNTEPLFEYATETNLALPPVSLQPHGIAQLLRNYPDPKFVENINAISTHGAGIGHQGPKVCIRSKSKLSGPLYTLAVLELPPLCFKH